MHLTREFNNIQMWKQQNVSCDVKNIINVMKCRGCGEEYIEETGNFLCKWVTLKPAYPQPPNKNA